LRLLHFVELVEMEVLHPGKPRIFHCYLSEPRFHFYSETFHSQLLSRWAALLRAAQRFKRTEVNHT
jgi:hypothetical protein